MSRTENAMKNMFSGFIGNIRGIVLSFITRTVFIYVLGSTYLGISGLYSSILSVLSLTELGFGSALTFAMYKPVAENDEEQILKLLRFYRTVHRIVALIVTTLGLLILPFLQYLVKGGDHLTLFELRLYFLIYLANSVASYFVSYKYCYLYAQQKGYITTNIDTIVSFIVAAAQIIVLLITKNFLVYLVTQVALTIVSKFGIAYYLNTQFPILHKKSDLRFSKEEKRPIYLEVRGLLVHNFSGVAVTSTDNIIISSLASLGIAAVGLVSNYNLIITSVLSFVSVIFGCMTAGFGNLVATNDTENYHKVFTEANFLNFWVYGFCAIAFFVLIPPFITLWIGEQYLIDQTCLLLMALDSYLNGQCSIYLNARAAKGNFGKDKWSAFCQAIVNLVVSVVAAKHLGLVGVYIGTVCSRLVLVSRPIQTYRFLFGRSSRLYYKDFVLYFLVVLAAGFATSSFAEMVLTEITVVRFVAAMAIVTVTPNLMFLLCFGKTERFGSILYRAQNILKRKK